MRFEVLRAVKRWCLSSSPHGVTTQKTYIDKQAYCTVWGSLLDGVVKLVHIAPSSLMTGIRRK
jgi:hypothetical protein